MSDIPRTPRSVVLLVTATLCGGLALMLGALAFSVVYQVATGWAPGWDTQVLAKDVTLILIGAVGGILASPRVRPEGEIDTRPKT